MIIIIKRNITQGKKKLNLKIKEENGNQIKRLNFKIKNLKIDMHYRVANDLVKNNEHVFISKFQVSNMIKKGQRKIRKKKLKKC